MKCEGSNFYKQCLPDPNYTPGDDVGNDNDEEGGDDETGGCCSQNYRDCDASWCGISREQCDNCGGDNLIYLEGGARSDCQERWSTCTDNPDACCPGLECKFFSTYYSQCLPVDGGVIDDPPTESPVDPTESPVDPTESPVDPTESPAVAGPDCENNPDPFFYKGKDVTCEELLDLGPQKRARKCREGRRLIGECPAICDEACATPSPTVTPREPCVDVPDEFEFKGETTSCAEIDGLGNQKKKRKCREGGLIREMCPTVCTEDCE